MRLIYDLDEICEFYNRFTDLGRNDLMMSSTLFVKASKSLDNKFKTRLVRQRLTPISNLDKNCLDNYINDIKKLDLYSNIIYSDDDENTLVPISNLAIYSQVNLATYDRLLAHLNSLINDIITRRLTNQNDDNSVIELKKILMGKGKTNGVFQNSVMKTFADYDIDLPDLENRRDEFNDKLIEFFTRLTNSDKFSIISTNGGAHVIVRRENSVYFGKLQDNDHLNDLYKSILPNGTDTVMTLATINKILPIYLGINPDSIDNRGHKIFEFTIANDGCPLPGTLQKGYKVKFIH